MATVDRQNDVTVVEIQGTFGSLHDEDLNRLRELLLELAESIEPPWMLLDLAKTNMIGSAFLEILFRAHKRLAMRHGRLLLCNLQSACMEVMQHTGLARFWPCLGSRDDGVALARKT